MNIDMEHPRTMQRTPSDAGFFRCVVLMVVSIFVIFMAIIGIAWLVMHPRDPSFLVTSLFVSNFTVSQSQQLRGKFEVGLTITNPNKKIQVILDRSNLLVLYGKVCLSVSEVQKPLFIEKMANKSVEVELVVEDTHKLVYEDVVKDWNKGVVNFNVEMRVRVRFESGIWSMKEKFLDVYCGDLDVEFFSPRNDGKLLGIGKGCHIDS